MPPKVTPDYSPVPTVAPHGPRDPSELVHINFPNVQFSGAVGEALGQLGRQGYGVLADSTRAVGQSLDNLGNQLEHTGDKLWNRAVGLKELQIETDVTKREIEYERWLGDKNGKFQQLQGDAASEEVLKAHNKEVEEKRNQMGQGLPEYGQKMWDKRTASSMINSIRSAATHAATETRKAALGASDARVDLKADQFSKEDDLKRSEQLFKEAHDEFFNTKVPLHGWSPDKAQEEWNKKASSMYSSKIARYADEDAVRANKMLEDNKDLMTGDDYTKVKHTVMDKFRQQYSRNIASEVQDKNPDAPLDQKRKAVQEKVEEAQKRVGIKDPGLAKAADDMLIGLHGRDLREQKEEYAKNVNNAKDAAYGYQAPGGKKPTTKDEFDLIPGAKEAYDALKPNEKHAIDQILLTNIKEDYPRTPATRDRVNTLMGEAGSERPEDREKFLSRDFHDEKIPGEDRDKLFAKQREMRGKLLKENPSVQRAYKVAGDLLPEELRTWRSPTVRKQFEGALTEALDLKMKENKGVPLKNEEIREIVSQLLKTVPGTGWFGSNFGAKSQYETMTEPSTEDLRQMKNEFPWAEEATLRDMYAKMRFQKFNKEYEALKKAGKPDEPAWKVVKPPTGDKPSVPQSQ